MRDYLVEAETAPGVWVNVYNGNNRTEAVRICNFWDEKVNTHFRSLIMERALETPLDQAMRRFDEAVAKLFG